MMDWPHNRLCAATATGGHCGEAGSDWKRYWCSACCAKVNTWSGNFLNKINNQNKCMAVVWPAQ